jgi:hypothetical protein
VFSDARGVELVRIPSGSVTQVFIVNPTLHELGGHAPQLAQLRALGLFPDQDLPWSVFINDLRVISETCDNAAIFLHYLVWRSRLPLGDKVKAVDEIDLWASYLYGERFGMLEDADMFVIANSTTDFDAYYDGLMGNGPKRPRPTKFLEQPVKAFIDRMAAERPHEWREAAGVCLDLSIPELAFVCGQAAEATRRATREAAPVGIQLGRTVLVGMPPDMELSAAGQQIELEEIDATLIVYVRQAKGRRAEIVWAEYAKPVTFELSEWEKAVFASPATSPFGSDE